MMQCSGGVYAGFARHVNHVSKKSRVVNRRSEERPLCCEFFHLPDFILFKYHFGQNHKSFIIAICYHPYRRSPISTHNITAGDVRGCSEPADRHISPDQRVSSQPSTSSFFSQSRSSFNTGSSPRLERVYSMKRFWMSFFFCRLR